MINASLGSGSRTRLALITHIRRTGSKYIFTSRDSDGNRLNGSNSYTLKVPANVPAKDFWSVCVYDTKTRSVIDTGRPMSALNSYMNLPAFYDKTWRPNDVVKVN